MIKFSSINLWCTKNLVDTQYLLGNILYSGKWKAVYVSDPFDKEVEIVFLNTCFIFFLLFN